MKVKHYLVSAIIIALMLCIGCANKEPSEVDANDSSISTTPLLTLTHVTKAFSTNNMKLVPNKTLNPQQFQLKSLKPSIFAPNNQDDSLLFIYTFPTYIDSLFEAGEREEFRAKFSKYYQTEHFYYNVQQARNIVIVHTTLNFTDDTFKKVNDVVFYQLNEGKDLVFEGKGQNWQAQILYNYYEHWYKNDTGSLKHDSYHTKRLVLKYHGPKINRFNNFKYEYDGAGGGGAYTTTDTYPLDENGYLYSGSGGGNGALHPQNLPYIITIYWNDSEETIELNLAK